MEVTHKEDQPPALDFCKMVSIRITKEQRLEIEKMIYFNQDKYESLSHFIRCGALKLLRQEKEALKND